MSIRLFTQPDFINAGALIPQQWEYLKERTHFKLKTVLTYFYTRAPYLVKHQSILTRLLHSLQTPLDLPLERYATVVEDDALHAAQFLKMTTVSQKGQVFVGGFYSKTDPEIYIAVNEYFNVDHAYRNWRSIAAVKPLIHPRTSLSLFLPNGTDQSEEKGLSVIWINPALLAVQYRAFLEYCVKNKLDADMTHFLSRYVIPNMMVRGLEIAFMNRLMNQFYGLPVSDNEQSLYSVMTPDLVYYDDTVIDHILTNLTRCKNRFEVILQNIPSFYKGNMLHLLSMPDTMPTRQIDWALFTARLKHYSFVIDCADKQTGSPNQNSLGQVRRSLSIYESANVMKETLPQTEWDIQKVYLNNVYKHTGQDQL